VTLTLRPPGRGNWKPVTLRVEGEPHLPPPMFFAVGQRLTLGGMVFRVAKVLP
jgi:hypothetical protein